MEHVSTPDNVNKQTDDGGDNFIQVFVSCDGCDEWFQTMDTPMCHELECHGMIHHADNTGHCLSIMSVIQGREVKFHFKTYLVHLYLEINVKGCSDNIVPLGEFTKSASHHLI